MTNAKTELTKLIAPIVLIVSLAAIALSWKAFSDLKARVKKLEEIGQASAILSSNTKEIIEFQGEVIVELDKRVSELEATRAAE